MMKVTSNAYVFKFVGGEPGQTRKCHYCQQEKLGGMVCVYPNCDCDRNDTTIYVCPTCVVRGCTESEQQWAEMFERSRRHDTDD